jgi:hypothetical protein
MLTWPFFHRGMVVHDLLYPINLNARMTGVSTISVIGKAHENAQEEYSQRLDHVLRAGSAWMNESLFLVALQVESLCVQ